MWPSASTVFKAQPCPAGDSCEIPYCLFSHKQSTTPAGSAALAPQNTLSVGQPPAKRLRLVHDDVPHTGQSDQTSVHAADPPIFTGLRAPQSTSTPQKHEAIPTTVLKQTPADGTTDNALPRTAIKPVSPPPKKANTAIQSEPEVEVKLIPRTIQHNPIPIAKRLVRLQAIHKMMTPLNDKTAKALKASTKALHLSANQLTKLAIDEEALVATKNTVVYDNVINHRILGFKKMTQEEWVAARREAAGIKDNELPKKAPPKKVETGLRGKEEAMFLSTMLAPQERLVAHGFVTKKPSKAEIEDCRLSQVASDFWEVCDRCRTRFQAFPERREKDGALTSGGKCKYHWGRKVYPKKSRGEEQGSAKYSCCNEPMGSEGCIECDTHVYKFTNVKRMSLVMPFIETPQNDKVEPHTAVCFDCEMGYTTQGFELLRLTVVSWPSHRPIIDVLVRPLGFILDLNTRWSGITMDQFLNAKPYDPANPKPNRRDMRIVDSPYVARQLFLAHVSPTTPVLGHALENDLNVIRLIHPTIVDTVILYPTPKGLPYRNGLKALAKAHLDMDIQQGGSSGHDSYEDARTTGELIRFKVAQNWKKLKDEGWVVRDGGVFPPLPVGLPAPNIPAAPSMIPLPRMAAPNGGTGMKRKFGETEDDD